MIYIFLIFFFLILFFFELKNPRDKTFIYWLGTFVFIALFALRGDNVGGDTLNYCLYFEGNSSSAYGTLKNNDDMEIGFRGICMFLQCISHSRFWFIFSTSLLSLVPFVMLVKKYNIFPSLAYLYIICSNWCIMVVCIETHIRQNIATGILMLALYIFMSNDKSKKKNALVILLVLLSLITHTSMYLILPLLFVIYFVPFSKRGSILVVIGSCIVTLFLTNFFADLFANLMLLISPYEVFEHITRYADSEKYGLSNKAILFSEIAPVALFALINIYYATKVELNNIFMKSLVVGTSVTIMASTFGMSFRMMYALLLLGYCYVPIAYKTNRKALFLNFVPLVWLLYRLWGAVLNPASYNSESHYLPYMFIFE